MKTESVKTVPTPWLMALSWTNGSAPAWKPWNHPAGWPKGRWPDGPQKRAASCKEGSLGVGSSVVGSTCSAQCSSLLRPHCSCLRSCATGQVLNPLWCATWTCQRRPGRLSQQAAQLRQNDFGHRSLVPPLRANNLRLPSLPLRGDRLRNVVLLSQPLRLLSHRRIPCGRTRPRKPHRGARNSPTRRCMQKRGLPWVRVHLRLQTPSRAGQPFERENSPPDQRKGPSGPRHPPTAASLATGIGGATKSGFSDLAYLNGDASVLPEQLADARLRSPVSLEMASTSLPDLVGHLRSATGVELVIPEALARYSIAVYCSEKPLAEVMRQMARLLDIGWRTAEQAGQMVYRAVPRPRLTNAQRLTEETPQSDVAAARSTVRKEIDAALMGDPEMVSKYRAGRASAAGALPKEGWILFKSPQATPK